MAIFRLISQRLIYVSKQIIKNQIQILMWKAAITDIIEHRESRDVLMCRLKFKYCCLGYHLPTLQPKSMLMTFTSKNPVSLRLI